MPLTGWINGNNIIAPNDECIGNTSNRRFFGALGDWKTHGNNITLLCRANMSIAPVYYDLPGNIVYRTGNFFRFCPFRDAYLNIELSASRRVVPRE
jgi:hypothetical protein